MTAQRILLLGGTAEAAELAARLRADPRFDITVSQAGRTSGPSPAGAPDRRGGFGGADGLAAFLRAERIAIVIDATHPFAATISPNARAACLTAGIGYLRVERPPWLPGPGDRWTIVPDIEAAGSTLPLILDRCEQRERQVLYPATDHDSGRVPGAVLLAVGSGGLARFLPVRGLRFVARTIEPPRTPVPPTVTVVRGRGPFTVEAERALFDAHGIVAVVTKNAGGDATFAKLAVARERGLPVVMVDRPPGQPAPDASDIEGLLRLLDRHRVPDFRWRNRCRWAGL